MFHGCNVTSVHVVVFCF